VARRPFSLIQASGTHEGCRLALQECNRMNAHITHGCEALQRLTSGGKKYRIAMYIAA
jgi:hypothetical protein